MNEKPLATVAMVTYNSAKYVATAIESVLCQSYGNLELVICDDCSTDGTWAIVESYKDRRIKAFRNEHNLGEYANRNKALQLAEGEYIIYIDGDDILYPHGLEFMVRMLHAFPAAGMAMARPWSEKFVYPFELSSREFYLCQYLGQDVAAINFAHLLLRTSALRDVGGLETSYKSGDTYIQFRIALKYNSLLISDGLAWWRRTPGQASEKLLRDHLIELESLQYRHSLLAEQDCPLTHEEIKLALSNLYGGFIRLLLYCALRGRPVHALSLLRRAHIPLKYLKYLAVRGHYPYMADVTAAHPLSAGLKPNPFARLPTPSS